MKSTLAIQSVEAMSTCCMFCRGKNNLCTSSKIWSKPVEMIDSFFNFNVDMLPESILLHIFSFMGYRELLNARCTCRMWKRIAEDKQLWRSINMSCKRIQENNMLFRLPERICENVCVVNLMWTYMSISAFELIKTVFNNAEVMLLQYCRFSIQSHNAGDSKQTVSLPYKLRVLDVRNVQGSWFDETGSITSLDHIEAMAFSQTMPSDWLSQLSLTWLPKLLILNIQNNPSLSDMFLKCVINNAPNLESLCIPGCMYVRGLFLDDAIKKLTNLRTLDLSGTRLESRSVYSTPWERSKICDLNLSFCCKIFEPDLKHMLPKLRQLRQLQASFVGWGRAFSDEVVSQMLSYSNMQLYTLDIQSTFGMSIASLVAICAQSANMQHLRIGTIIKTEEDLTWLLSNISSIRSLSLQMGESNFKAPFLFNTLSSKCGKLESLFIYNIAFDPQIQTDLISSLESLFTKCTQLRNFFTGGYPYKHKQTLEAIAKNIKESLKLKLNCDRPVRIVPQPDVSFDRYLCDSLGKKSYHATALRASFEKTINCQSFYRTGLQKLEDRQFALQT